MLLIKILPKYLYHFIYILGTKTEFSNMFERPIQNGQCLDSTPRDMRLMMHRAHVLHNQLKGFVQRRSHRVLRKNLPPKYEHVLLGMFSYKMSMLTIFGHRHFLKQKYVTKIISMAFYIGSYL